MTAVRRRPPRVLSRDDAKKLLAVPKTGCPTGLRNRVALELTYRAGLRVSEVVKLRPGDVRKETGEVVVVNGEGGRDRVVPVDAETLKWIRRWAKDPKRARRARTFLCTLRRKTLSADYLRQTVKRCVREAGLDAAAVSPCVLRHFYATELLNEGFTIREVQELLGHKSIQTTRKYTDVRPTRLAKGHTTMPRH
jgi:integrase/recombinase XerD